MKKLLLLCTFALLVVAVVVACSDGSTSTPVTPTVDDSAGLANVTGARRNATPTRLCHHNPDVNDGDPLWVVIEKDNSVAWRHCKHGDYDDTSDSVNVSGSCPDCDLSGLDVGDDCCHCDGGPQSCGTI
ncbi:MAG TPA: hypothetical protein VGC00_10935 [Thermoanaerobaculia bacterium]